MINTNKKYDLNIIENICPENIYKNIDVLFDLCEESKKLSNSNYYRLPLYNIEIEEFLGVEVKYGLENMPFSKDYAYNTIDNLKEKFKEIELIHCSDRYIEINKILSRKMKLNNGKIIYEIEGPFSKLGRLIDILNIYKGLIKKKEDVLFLLEKVSSHILQELESIVSEENDIKFDILSFADPSFSKELIGPRNYKMVIENFYLYFLENIRKKVQSNRLIHLCPKLVYDLSSVYGEDLDDLVKINIINNKGYEKLIESIEVDCFENADFIAGKCINNI